ncbi:energy-coupling factor ABC transporter permease [Vibrio kasasachensis]|uniref:energy-coupling factor ABC transporter permease n=1 Tax=Vibrio kasasachensis TaxID=2910248 RepID=UPI003D113B57
MLLTELFTWAIALLALIPCYSDIHSNFVPKLMRESSFQHLTFAICFILFLLWSAEAGIKIGLGIHFLGLTCLTLMYGWRIAYLVCWPIVSCLVLFGPLSLASMGQFLLLSCFVPILTSYGIFLISYHFLPRNIFVYIFVAGFINGAISGSIHLLVTGLFYLLTGVYSWPTIVDNYLLFMVLLAFPEGFLNGIAITVLTVFKPEWLRTFSDRDYIYSHYHKK